MTVSNFVDQAGAVGDAALHIHVGHLFLPQRQEFSRECLVGQSAKLSDVLPKRRVPDGGLLQHIQDVIPACCSQDATANSSPVNGAAYGCVFVLDRVAPAPLFHLAS